MNQINDDGNIRSIKINKSFKILYVTLVIGLVIYLIVTDNWYQGLIVLNIALNYRDFISFFTDFSEETVITRNQDFKCKRRDDIEDIIKLNEKYGPANINLSDSYDDYSNNMYANTDIDNKDLSYYDYFIEQKNNETFYKNLYNKHEKENFITYKLGETNISNLNGFDSFSTSAFQRDKKIYENSKLPYPNDDIKLMNLIDLNTNLNWWERSMELDF